MLFVFRLLDSNPIIFPELATLIFRKEKFVSLKFVLLLYVNEYAKIGIKKSDVIILKRFKIFTLVAYSEGFVAAKFESPKIVFIN